MHNWGDIFEYRNGDLYWKIKPKHGKVCVGDLAGCVCSTTSYRLIKYKQNMYLAHHIIWEMHNGPIPEGYQIDHFDRNRLNNNIENLFLVTPQQNQQNRNVQKNNKLGVTGVYFHKNAYDAFIHVNGKTIYLGRFKDIEDAIRARRDAEIKYGFHKYEMRNPP
ncbi:HNH endonuclease signature motif containing protein [Escherichia coli]|uniref:HNH endonuclease signature motif containing protein n=1 Tax=Escherichia coli TaxID=562 RepID=UPI0010210708|nr:HNH endonuclease signature motif containing protein [Escherichia coli]